LIPGWNTVFGLIPILGADIGLHTITALISAYFGWLAPATVANRANVARV
jgi:hypothetical protein